MALLKRLCNASSFPAPGGMSSFHNRNIMALLKLLMLIIGLAIIGKSFHNRNIMALLKLIYNIMRKLPAYYCFHNRNIMALLKQVIEW